MPQAAWLPGTIVTETEDGKRLRTVMMQAAFSMNHRFVLLLIRHLDDPPGQPHGDYFDPSPSHEAMTALSQIVFGKEYYALSLDAWKA